VYGKYGASEFTRPSYLEDLVQVDIRQHRRNHVSSQS